jgi:hypothetical protein
MELDYIHFLTELTFFLQLFDLLGFHRFELIQSLLEHRRDIVYNASFEEEKKFVSSQSGKISL